MATERVGTKAALSLTPTCRPHSIAPAPQRESTLAATHALSPVTLAVTSGFRPPQWTDHNKFPTIFMATSPPNQQGSKLL
jgi:hypothetical protein